VVHLHFLGELKSADLFLRCVLTWWLRLLPLRNQCLSGLLESLVQFAGHAHWSLSFFDLCRGLAHRRIDLLNLLCRQLLRQGCLLIRDLSL